MFSLDVVDTDDFLDMPASSQNLYFHLGMRADDDGFVANPKKIVKIVCCSTDDFRLLIQKGFVIPFESGVCVIRDWKRNNHIQADRYHETVYLEEKNRLQLSKSGQFHLLDTECIQDVSNLDTQDRLGKGRIGEVSTGKSSPGKELGNKQTFPALVQMEEKEGSGGKKEPHLEGFSYRTLNEADWEKRREAAIGQLAAHLGRSF